MNTGISYKQFYEILLELRELFHSYGRIDDSNTKLDEITKLISMAYYEAQKGNKFSLKNIRTDASIWFCNENSIALALRKKFEIICCDKMFTNEDGTNIFGSSPSLNIQPSEDFFAEKLISGIEKIDFINLLSNNKSSEFDVINECFGHFVRENFRNNKEDAQYMTPAEITCPIIDIVFNDMIKSNYFSKIKLENFKILDPTCGVGTLLVETARKYINYISNTSPQSSDKLINLFLKRGVIGQDKVDRMVRLSKINTMLMGGNISNIHMGNSIMGNSYIDTLSEKIDFIFTNPPFGAEYNIEEIDHDKFPLITELSVSGKTISSEILILLKCISLLKKDGYLAIVLPDSVFSAKGIYSQVRDLLLSKYTINAIFELPTVTFAQAGTRTKTSILYLQKKKPNKNHKINMCICNDIGFTVKERMGVPVKIDTGLNEMPIISKIYVDIDVNDDLQIISSKPSITSIHTVDLIDKILNSSFYSADRLNTLSRLNKSNFSGITFKKLSEIAEFQTLTRKSYNADKFIKHISVLHINADSTIDFSQVENFNPISKGRMCYEGDILFSKINPRIPRMAIIPPYPHKLVCSNEFEILKTKDGFDANMLCLLLKTDYVSKQIADLTSGTSSSHSRIKREQLSEILIPVATDEETQESFLQISKKLHKAWADKYSADSILNEQLLMLNSI